MGSPLELISNIVSIAALGSATYLYFVDPLRRWSFFGFRPTASVIIHDPKTHQFLLIKTRHTTHVWNFPQGAIYTLDINAVVDQILTREISIPKHLYKFYKTIPVGTIKRDPDRRYSEKYQPGSITLFPTPRGKGYLLCLVHADLAKFVKAARPGHNIVQIKAFSLKEALSKIPKAKAHLFAPFVTQV